jgi:hypothetical protein
MSAGWSLFGSYDLPSAPFRLFHYGPSPVASSGWGAFSPTITWGGLTLSQIPYIQFFAVRNGFVDQVAAGNATPVFSPDYGLSGEDVWTTQVNTWSSSNSLPLVFTYGDTSLYDNPPDWASEWAQWYRANPYTFPAYRTAGSRYTTTTQAPVFSASTTDSVAWIGFSIPYPNALGANWSIGRIAY